ncbi:acyl-[acyl-carrier-protein] thioesterase [Bacteroidales bacterium OttesenSCG-928-J19]|nr:acyl-[acyl-carrier-protein] thioesterase [Bacteroidales bacterium OttesenSCG-928-J19]
MLEKVGSYQFHIESYVCDFMGKATLPVVGNFILQAATIHAHERGFGYDAISKDAAAWVLSRLTIEMIEYPDHDTNITVETWVEDVARFFTNRCFRFLNQEGKTIGYARSIWAAINTTTRRPIDIPAWRPDLADFIEADKECLAEKPGKIPSVDNVEPSMGYSVRYSDIDINKHMNSVKYIEHIINVFDLDLFRRKHISRFEMVYLQEGGFADKMKLYKQEVSPDHYVIDTKRGEESICRSRILWTEHQH